MAQTPSAQSQQPPVGASPPASRPGSAATQSAEAAQHLAIIQENVLTCLDTAAEALELLSAVDGETEAAVPAKCQKFLDLMARSQVRASNVQSGQARCVGNISRTETQQD